MRGGSGIAKCGIVTAVFVIGLPSSNEGVLAVALGHQGDNAGAFGTIGAVQKTVMAPRAKAARLAIAVDGDHVGMLG